MLKQLDFLRVQQMEGAQMQVFSEEMCRRLELLNSARRELVQMGYAIKGEMLDAPAFELPVTIALQPLSETQSIALLERSRGLHWRIASGLEIRDVMFMGVRVVWEAIE